MDKTPQERARIEADKVLDKILDMVDNDGRVSLEALPIIETALQDAERRGYERGVTDGERTIEVIKKYNSYDDGFNKGRDSGLKEASEIARNHEITDAGKQALRCNPNGKQPYVGTEVMNGFNWACDEVAQAIEALRKGERK